MDPGILKYSVVQRANPNIRLNWSIWAALLCPKINLPLHLLAEGLTMYLEITVIIYGITTMIP